MFNFLDCKLSPQVTSSCPSTDGYEASNLISTDFQLKSKGFLAYTAIKPPVHIDFKLICPINIHYIKIWTSVGSQKSSAFEILVKSSANDFNVVSKVYNGDSGVIIYNRRFYLEKSKSDNYTVHFFKSSEFRHFTCAEQLRLRILHTASSVPCIGNIEIWGNVSRICSKVTIDTINYLMNGARKQCVPLELNPSSTVARNQHELKFQIPDEFIDPISCEMMSLPMTLPSGKTIDQSTLEKCQESESKWGRSPSDPFTGQSFTTSRKPVLNASLKCRIDAFLIKHADVKETQQIQRTVGRKPQANKRTLEYPSDRETKKRIITEEPANNQLPSSSSNSLDDIIQNAIQRYNIVRYSAVDAQTSKTSEIMCVICEIKSNLYTLLCEHYVCRSCLLTVTSAFQCKKCNKISKKSDIKKYHN